MQYRYCDNYIYRIRRGVYNMKKLFRSRENRMICGVCGGVAEYFNIDPTLVRLGWVLVAACSFGTGIIAYFVAAIIMPDA